MTFVIEGEPLEADLNWSRGAHDITIGRYSFLDPEDGKIIFLGSATIGRMVIMEGSGVISIGEGVWIGDRVTIRSGEMQPGENGAEDAKPSYSRVTIESGCIIEPCCVIMPGVVLGEFSLVVSGAVVSPGIYKDRSVIVPPAAQQVEFRPAPATPEDGAVAEPKAPELPPLIGDQAD